MHFALPDRKESQEYHLKGQEIDASKGNALIKDSCDDMDLILLKKEYRDENDESIWKCAEKVLRTTWLKQWPQRTRLG